ncbi:VanZ family protein [Myxococcota bacterium]|nr:VanZ family protein [Myxococcota bacterium]
MAKPSVIFRSFRQVSHLTRLIRKRSLWILLAWVAGSAVLIGTLWPLPQLPSARNSPLSAQWQLYPPDILRNVILFAVPAAFTRRWRTRWVLALAAVFSVSIEGLQTLIPGRVPSLLDVLANVSGAWIGHRAVVWYFDGSTPRWEKHRTLYVGWVILTTLVLLTAPVAFSPHAPPRPWYLHAPPNLGHLEPYGGTVMETKLDGRALQSGRLSATDARTDFLSAHRVEIRGTAGAPPGQVSGLFLITDGIGREVALLGLQGTDLFYRVRTLGDHWGLETPRIWWRDAFPDQLEEGNAFVIRVEHSDTEVCLEVDRRRQCRMATPLEDGWQLWLPARAIGAYAYHGLGQLWLFALFLPIGLGYRRRFLESCLLLLPVSALMIRPWLGSTFGPTPENLVFIALGLTVGQGLAGWQRSRRRTAQSAG